MTSSDIRIQVLGGEGGLLAADELMGGQGGHAHYRNGPADCHTFLDLLKYRVESAPREMVYTVLGEDAEQEETLSYFELESLVTRIAHAIKGVQRLEEAGQSKVVLVLPQGKYFVAGFYACLAAGAIAVPTFPPRNPLQRDRLKLILQDLQDPIVLTDLAGLDGLLDDIEQDAALKGLRWLSMEDCLGERAGHFSEFQANPDDIAMLQYTSGSTGKPKGVIVSNRNLVENSRLIEQCFGHREGVSRSVIWLPPYHDMGLVGGILQPVCAGFATMLMPTNLVLRSPYRWLEAVSRFRGTSSGGPNFAFELCVNNIRDRQLEQLDLSSWNIAFCGAEPINYHTMQRFAERFGRVGFDPAALYPCYGMAEATLMVSGKPLDTHFKSLSVSARELGKNQLSPLPETDPESRYLVSSGRPHDSLDVRVVDPQLGIALKDGEIGEIWISGPSVAQGYWNDPAKTRQQFGLHIGGQAGHYMRSGDLGFLADGELFVTGRLKEVIIIRGVNFYPQDLEYEAAVACAELKSGRAVAFSVEAQEREQLVLAIEARQADLDFASLVVAINQRLIQKFGIKADKVVFVPRKTVKITSSGKLQRVALKGEYLDGSLSSYFSWCEAGGDVSGASHEQATDAALAVLDLASADSICLWLRAMIAKLNRCSLEHVRAEDPFAALGLDSVSALHILSVLEAEHGVLVSPESLYQFNTPQSLASEIARLSYLRSAAASAVHELCELAATPETLVPSQDNYAIPT
ncbi:hypothetical protein GCM10007907_05670 [Chitinimonas prasina]|uniref:Carrier domain-containing protein n=1 Tax=Chitinimonas prasina TaxID=1434937 RepID=A0ABQ5YA02_9NEIS|nr:AMP-binding protein [Chitinimonas prasina]GLR11777.1 hypothetical protein GCM10007907_05670 [Chitinimonas prasina]